MTSRSGSGDDLSPSWDYFSSMFLSFFILLNTARMPFPSNNSNNIVKTLLLLLLLLLWSSAECAHYNLCDWQVLTNTHTHTTILWPSEICPGSPEWATTRTNLDFTEARDNEWQWHQLGHMQICTSPQLTTPTPHLSVFYRPDALPVAQPTASKHWRQISLTKRWRKFKALTINLQNPTPHNVYKKPSNVSAILMA